MDLSNDSLDLLGGDQLPDIGGGKPLQLSLDGIDEDPQQPRIEFDAESLQELAQSISQRGVLQPISVRPHPAVPQRWMINFGARRFRASRLAGKTTIPAFLDDCPDSYDQVLENEQRRQLTPLELAMFVGRRMVAGESQSEIARRMSKSRQYVTYARALIDCPDWLLNVYRSGRCRGIRELYELRRLYEQHPEEAAALVEGDERVTYQRLGSLRDALDGEAVEPVSSPPTTRASSSVQPDAASCSNSSDNAAAPSPKQRPRRHSLEAEFEGRVMLLATDAVPTEPRHVYVTETDGHGRRSVHASQVTLLGFVAHDAS